MGSIDNVAIIGAGIMGHGIAQEYATAGLKVTVYDSIPSSLEQAKERIRSNLTPMVRRRAITAQQAQSTMGRIHLARSLAEAAQDADFVVEAVSEDLSTKQEVFRRLDDVCPAHAVLATNTSGLSITAVGSATKRPDRVVGTHYFNPSYLIPLVEVVPGKDTSRPTLEQTSELLRSIGKVPVLVKKDVPGFVWNRLQFALLREACWLVANGVASVEDVDLVVRKGLGRRLSLMGPFETADFGGLDTFAAISEYLWKDLDGFTVLPGRAQMQSGFAAHPRVLATQTDYPSLGSECPAS